MGCQFSVVRLPAVGFGCANGMSLRTCRRMLENAETMPCARAKAQFFGSAFFRGLKPPAPPEGQGHNGKATAITGVLRLRWLEGQEDGEKHATASARHRGFLGEMTGIQWRVCGGVYGGCYTPGYASTTLPVSCGRVGLRAFSWCLPECTDGSGEAWDDAG